MTQDFVANWATKYQAQRDRYWPEVESYFGDLPSPLYRQSVLLRNNLATFYSDSGQFKDILKRDHDSPLLYLHFWLLDDFGVPDSPERAKLERHLLLAISFTFAAVYTRETILDASSNFDTHYLFLEQALTRQTDLHLAQIQPAPSPFWDYHHTFWQEYAAASLWRLSNRQEWNGKPIEAEVWPLAGKLAYAKMPVVLVALQAGRESSISRLCAMLDQFNLVFQIMQEITTIQRDLGRRHVTYPIMRTMQAAGLDPRQPITPERMLGALVLTGSIEKIGQECLSRLEHCRTVARTLDLPSFVAYAGVLEEWVGEIRQLFSVRAKSTNSKSSRIEHKPRRPIFAPYVDTLQKVIDMAEGYLLSDLSFRESWEVQRRGAFGVPEMTGKAFPAGLITEILCRHKHQVTEAVDAVFDTLQATNFRYYDYSRMPPDTDDLGLLLRLYRYSGQPDKHREVLQKPLGWLTENIQDNGEIPVWLTRQESHEKHPPPVALWGRSCATVEANLLLGLIDYDWEGYRPLIEKSAIHLFDRLSTKGLNASWHYVPLYSLWANFELMAKLSAKPIPERLQRKLDTGFETLTEQLGSELKRPGLTPQEAAFLTLICLSDGLRDTEKSLLDPGWITVLCKTQRYDGSWRAEPLFGTPTRGELASWYASRTVTTTYCYHALKTFLAMSRETAALYSTEREYLLS